MRNLCACVANRVTFLRPKGWGFSPRVSYLRRVLANYPAGAGIRQRRTQSVPPWGEVRGWIDPCRPTDRILVAPTASRGATIPHLHR